MPIRGIAPQDDTREQEMLRIFGLRQDLNTTRDGTDAFIRLENGKTEQIELKSSTKDTLVTARDFGRNHINSWRKKHVLGSFYDKGGNNIEWSIFIPNKFLNLWLDKQLEYIFYDIEISNQLEKLLKSSENLQNITSSIFGAENYFNETDLKRLMKKQYSKLEYEEITERVGRKRVISRKNMSSAVLDRILYLLDRGSTRNNPHINKSDLNEIISKDTNLRLIHEKGDYSTPAKWFLENLERYKIHH